MDSRSIVKRGSARFEELRGYHEAFAGAAMNGVRDCTDASRGEATTRPETEGETKR